MMNRVKRFTPGPWSVQKSLEEYDTWCVVGDGWGIVNITKMLRADGIAEAEANAHLIAAAPDLLEALEEARDTIQAVIDEGYLGYFDQRSRIDAAIAKAYGEEA